MGPQNHLYLLHMRLRRPDNPGVGRNKTVIRKIENQGDKRKSVQHIFPKKKAKFMHILLTPILTELKVFVFACINAPVPAWYLLTTTLVSF